MTSGELTPPELMPPERADVVSRVVTWFAHHARVLPWREADVTPWGILVSEIMLQQTPVSRVLPVWTQWLFRWPDPVALANDEPSEAVRAWGRLGYPRRARRLHEAAVMVRDHHEGAVPQTLTGLRALPGVGAYTAAAVATFAFGQRHVVLDTNVRRVLARVESGVAYPAPAVTAEETRQALEWLPADPTLAATWAAASMELGALVCSARSPRCEVCPIADACAWQRTGQPPWQGPPRRGQSYAGTDRQCRGTLLAVLREAHDGVARPAMLKAWESDPVQAERALRSLLDDGLAREAPDGRVYL